MSSEFPISLVIKAIDKVTEPLRKINARIANIIAKINEPAKRLNNAFHALSIEAGFEQLIDRSRRLGSSITNVWHESVALAEKLSAISVIAGGAIFGLAKTTADAGDEIARTAAKLGVSTQKLQEWHFAAERSNISQETFDQSLQRLSVHLAQAAIGSNEIKDILNALSIPFKTAHGKIRSLEEVLPQLADKLQRVKSESVRNAIAFKLFGREGVDLVNFLKNGSQGLNELADQSRTLGLVLSNEGIRSSVKFKETWDQLKSAFTSVRMAVGTLLLPVISDLMQKLSTFLMTNREKIIAWTKLFIARLPEALQRTKEAFLSFKETMMPIIHIVQKIVNLLGGLKGVAIAVGVVISSKLILSILALASAFRSLLLVFLANPVIAGITAIGVAIYFLIKHWQKVKAVVLHVMDAIKNAIHDGVVWIKNIIEDVFSGIKNFLDQLNPFSAIHAGIEKTKHLFSSFKLSNNAAFPALHNNVWEPAWGASHLVRKVWVCK